MRRKLRFAFTIQSGPNEGLTLPGWRLWVSGEDTYIRAKTVGHVWKTSLHGDSAWQHAMTSEHVRSGRQPTLPKSGVRAMWKFTPTPFINRTRMAYVIAVTRGCLRPGGGDPQEIQIPVEDRWDKLTMAKVWMTEKDVDAGMGSHPHLVGDPFTLSSGRKVWVTATAEDWTSIKPEPIPDGVLLEPWSPENHDVAAPGLYARGLNWRT